MVAQLARLAGGLAVLAATSGCDNARPSLPPVTMVSFNVAGADAIADPIVGQAIADQIAGLEPAFAALQECVSCDALLQKLPDRYALVEGGEDSEVAVLYDEDTWIVVDTGTIVLGDDDDGWGRRDARWAKLAHLDGSAPVYVYSTHWCVPVRSRHDSCDVDRQLAYGRTLLRDIAHRNAPVLLGGDFNVFDGFESGPVIDLLVGDGLLDTLRAVTDAPVITFEGNSWAPAGRIDYVFATAPAEVVAASVASESASDHRPVSATIAY